MNQERKKNLIFFIRPILIFAVCGAIIIFGYSRIKSQGAEAARLQNEFALMISKNDSQLSLKQDYEKAKPEMAKLEDALPSTDQLQKIADTINLVAVNTGNIISFRQSSAVESLSKDVSFEININGTMDSLFKFLSEVEKLPYFTETGNFKISFSSGFTGNIGSSFNLKVYLR